MEIKLLRSGEKGFADIGRGSQKRRFKDKSIIDQALILDVEWKKFKYKFDFSKTFFNKISKTIGAFKKTKFSIFLLNLLLLKKKTSKFEKLCFFFEGKRDETLFLIGNLIHNSCSFGNNEKNSRIDYSKKRTSFFKINFLFNHFDLLEMIGAVDYEKGRLIAGNRGYFLKGIGLLLNKALIRYGLDFLIKKNFIGLHTPFIMIKKILSKCSQLEDFKEQLYGLMGYEDKFLIATSEQPITGFHYNEKIFKQNLPIKYAGFSTCFRKESGSHGKDTSGIFRVHQFEKIEQFIICNPEDLNSWHYFEELLKNVKDFYSSLDIPFEFINISSSSLNSSAAKKIDLLGFFPKNNTFRELVSCSNCTFFQSEKLNIKVTNGNKNIGVSFPHMLNATLCATSRVICCIVENFQTTSGILIPNVLRSYMGISFAPFTKKIKN